MRATAVPIVLVAILVVSAGFTLAPGAELGVSAAGHSQDLDAPDRPILVFDIHLDVEGNATWNISARFPIGEPSEAEAFEDLADEYTDGDPEQYLPLEPFARAAPEIGDTVDRSMSVDNVSRNVVRTEETGMLTLEFEWTAFAHAEDGRVTVGDAFAATEEPWLRTLEEDQYILIHAPENHTVESSGFPVHDRTMRLGGPADLGDGELTGTFVSGAAAVNGNGDRAGVGEAILLAPLLAGAGAVLGLLALLFAVGYWRRWTPVTATVSGLRTAPGEDATDETAPAEADEPPDELAGPLAERDLLGDEELVLRLVEYNGGRMKQASIVEETDWSNAKVSQLLSEMAEAGQVEKLRIGRENLITLADVDAEE